MAATHPRRTRARARPQASTPTREDGRENIIDMSAETEFRSFGFPRRNVGDSAKNIGMIAGGIMTFIGFVLAAYAVSETRKLRDSMNSGRVPPYLTKDALASAEGASLYRGAGSWHAQKELPGALGVSDLQAVAGETGKIYIIGGVDTNNNVLNRTLSYDSVRQTYETKASMSTKRHRFGAAVFTDATSGAVTDIVVASGYEDAATSANGFDPVPFNSSEKYNLATDTWSNGPSLSTAHKDGCMASTGDAVYMIGGWDMGWTSLKKVEKLARGGSTWQTMADLPAARGDCAAAGLNGKVYVAGGYDSASFDHGEGFKNNLYVYDPATNTWTEKAPMNYARGDLQLVVKGDTLLAIGGEIKYTKSDGTHENVVASHYVEEYYPEKDRWEVRAPLGEARFRFGAATSIWGTHVFGGSPVCNGVGNDCTSLQSETHEVFFELDHPDVWVNL